MNKDILNVLVIGTLCLASTAFAHPPRIPEPVCQTESECLKSINDCAYVGNNQVIFTAKLRVKQVCVAYNGLVSHITTEPVSSSDNFNDFFPADSASIARGLKNCRSARKEYLKITESCSK